MQLLSLFPFLGGINELHIVFLLNIVLLGLLFYKVYKNKKIILTKDIKFILILIWSLSYFITAFYSADTELAFLGFLKFLTVPIFIVLIMQYEYNEKERDNLFEAIGKIGAVMVIICLSSILISKADLFFYQNRLSGFFQYANSFAMFLLIGFISTGFKKDFKVTDYFVTGILLIGIILTNSRSLMIITAVSYIAILIFGKSGKKIKFINTVVIITLGIITVLMAGAFGVSNRLGAVSGNAGEWVLRILYYKDALRMISENIFGYGYMAWWYMQEGVQTGVYDAQYVHNGLLQVALDAGVIPALLIVVIFIKSFFEKNRDIRDKVLTVIILGHALIDFDIEFLAITLILFMTLEFDKKVTVKGNSIIKSSIFAMTSIYAFFFTVTALGNFGLYDTANKLFSYSFNLDGSLQRESNFEKSVKISEKLYEKNKYFVNAAKILSEKAQLENNYEKAYEYELWILRNKKYTMLNYIEYVSFLDKAVKHYYAEGNTVEVRKYISKLNDVEKTVNAVKESSDELAYKIVHKPRLDIPKEVTDYTAAMNEFEKTLR